MKKIIGTSLPFSSLYSEKNKKYKNGIIDDGILFLEWLFKTKQHAWQILPIHETQLIPSSREHMKSPYKSYGMGIDPRYGNHKPASISKTEIDIFKEKNSYWLSDYALFCAIRDYYKSDNWLLWEDGIRKYDQHSVLTWEKKLEKEINLNIQKQYLLHKEYGYLKESATKKNILLIGDMQYYLPLNSPLVWAHQKAFHINNDNKLINTSGIPYKKGVMYGRQVWGHPLYNWRDTDIYQEIISLFIMRLTYLATLYDMVRIDHASGFFRYGSINLIDRTKDQMMSGPGEKALRDIIKYSKDLKIKVFAEDAGYDLGDLRISMKSLNIPGVRVLRCAFDEVNKLFIADHAEIQKYPQNCVAYTTTHDTETLIDYVSRLTTEERKRLSLKLGIAFIENNNEYTSLLRKTLITSPPKYIIIPLQDWLLTHERINTPGTEKEKGDQNWQYRMPYAIEELPILDTKV